MAASDKPDLPPIEWRVHLKSSPGAAFDLWASDKGRMSFWAERSRRTERGFALEFPNGQSLEAAVLEANRPERFVFRYFGGSTVTVSLAADGRGGCDLHLSEEGCPLAEHLQNYAGWVSVLLAFKASLDFGIDLRSHDPDRSWEHGYVDV